MLEYYSHSEHAEMEWYNFSDFGGRDVEGWRCTKCHVIAKPDEADEVFDNHDCGQYEKVRKGITDTI